MNAPVRLRIGAILLAAGESSRMGRPKALLPLEGKTFLEVLGDRLIGAGVSPIALVLGASAGEIESSLNLTRFRVVRNPDPSRGQLSSILCGLDALAADRLDGVFLAPVDTPRVRIESLERMMASLPGRRLVVPTYRGRRGHPPLFAASLFSALRAAPPDAGARAVVHATVDRLDLDCGDPAVIEDFDQGEDLKTL